MAPLADLTLGLRILYSATAPSGTRISRMYTDGQLAFFFDYMKTFALTPDPPNVARTTGFVSGLVSGFSASGRF